MEGDRRRVIQMPVAISLLLALGFILVSSAISGAEGVSYPQIIRTRYEARDPKAGGHFTIWLERETLRLGLDHRLYPAVSYVEVTHISPTAGAPLLTLLEVQAINADGPEFYHIGGIVRFKLRGMTKTFTNASQ